MLTVLTLVVYGALSSAPQPTNTWAPAELRDARYTVIDETEKSVFVERKADRARLLIRATASRPEAASRRILTNAINEPLDAMPFSEVPFGRQLICPVRPGNVAIDALGNYEGIRLSLSAPIVSEAGRRFNRPDDLAAEGRWAEAIARKAFAAYASRRLGPAETIAVNGRAVALRKADKSNADMVDLEGWASATGLR